MGATALASVATFAAQSPLTPMFQLNSTSIGYQAPSSVAIDNLGRALVDYRDSTGFPTSQVGRFLEVDNSLSPEFPLGPQDGSIGDSGLVPLSRGGWVYAGWYPPPPQSFAGARLQFLDHDGGFVGTSIALGGANYIGLGQDIEVGLNDDLFLTIGAIPRSRPTEPSQMYFERFGPAGEILVEPVAVSAAPTTDAVTGGSLATDPLGRSFVAWGEIRPDTEFDHRGRIVDAFGHPLTAIFDVPTSREGWQMGPAGVAALAGDRFVVAWEGDSPASPVYDVFYRLFAADGTPLSGDLRVSSKPTAGRFGASLSTADGSRFVIAWTGGEADVYFREFRADGTPVGDEVKASEGVAREVGEDTFPFVAMSKSGVIALAWSAASYDLDSTAVGARKYFRGCAADAPRLKLGGGRFEVCTLWTSFAGARGAGVPLQITDDTGGFWFFDADNLEVVVKILDGCAVNDRFWLYAAGLTDVEVTLGVIDTWTGQTWVRDTTLATPFPPIQDVAALPVCHGTPPPASAAPTSLEPRRRAAVEIATDTRQRSACLADAHSACLLGGRYRVSARFATAADLAGEALALPLNGQSTAFWFFGPTNLELFVKVLDACAAFGRTWVYAAGLTDVGVDLRVEDTETGQIRTYHRPAGIPFSPILDASAFADCP